MNLLPKSLAGRTLLVLLIGLGLSNLIGLAIYAGERHFALTAQRGRDVAEQIATVTRSFEQAPPADRLTLLRSIWAPGFTVAWSERSAVIAEDGTWGSGVMRRSIASSLDGYPLERIRIAQRIPLPGELAAGPLGEQGQPWAAANMHMRHMREMGMMLPMAVHRERMLRAWQAGQVLQASVQLNDGGWLNFAALMPRPEPFWWSRFFLSILLMTAAVTVLSVWAVRRSTRPLVLFAQAAERLGTDVNAPPVPEAGPSEVSGLARAFNEMQRRLKSFVQDRTQMLAAISHDLRTPITRLRLRADLVEDDEQKRKMLDDLEQMEAMIAATLSFAREDVLQEAQRPFDLAVLLQDLCDDAADRGQTAAFAGPAAFTYRGRPLAMKRVFTNLIDNAAQYGNGAEVTLSAAAEAATVTVEDSGPGIPEGELEKVFAPFYRLEGSRGRDTGGVGLGLASVRSIVRAHGGEVRLAKRPQGGLRVTITLPRGEP